MTWYDELDFAENPFTIKPRESFDEFIGNKKTVSQILDSVEKGEDIIIKGPYGSGKTSVLKSMIKKFGGNRKLFYYNAYSGEEVDVESVLKKAGLVSGFFRVRSKNVVFLVDEAHNLKASFLKELKKYKEGDWIKSIILVSTRQGFKGFKGFADKEYSLKKFSLDEAKTLVKNRLVDEHKIMPNKVIEKIYNQSKNPRDFLQRCEEACWKTVSRGSYKVSEKDL